MNRYKYLLKNIGILTLGSFATKLLMFFLVPLYTNVLSTTEYGIYDLFNTTIGVLIPILTLNIQESVMRFALEKTCNHDVLVSVAIRYLVMGSCVVCGGLWLNHIFVFIAYGKQYAVFFFLMYFMQALSGIVVAYIRGTDKIAQLSVSSVIASLVTIGCNLLFLLVFRWGLVGYFAANIIGPLLQSIYLVFASGMHNHIRLGNKYQEEEKEMLAYCKPFVANSLAWWVNNAFDRYVVIFFCGLAENGIYSVASKIPAILNVFQSIFSQAWTLSAVKDYDYDDKKGFFSNTYKSYNCFMVLMCSAIIVMDQLLARFLYAKDFFIAWKYVPWLTIAIVFGSLSGYIGGIFSAAKDSKIFAQSTVVGAIANLCMNFVLTPLIGALGAAIATMVAYVIVWLIRYQHSKKYIRLKLNLIRDIGSYIILVMQAILMLVIQESKMLYFLEISLFLVLVIMYAKDLKMVMRKIIKKY